MSATLSAFGSFGNELLFEDFEDVYRKVHSIVSELQLDVLERANAHRESYTVLHYILHECSAQWLPLPLKLVYNHPGSPDFRIVFTDGNELGVEITEATTAERQKALKEQAKEHQSGQAQVLLNAGINSGLVGSQIETAEKEARQKWVEIVAERIQGKSLKAAKYDYKHPIRLVVYSNTGYDFDDIEEAIKLLKKRLSESTLFESISILLGGKYLVGDVMGKHYHHVCYSEFDGIENAIDYLERTAVFLVERGPVHPWKWVWISLYEATYSFFICALQGTDPDRVLQQIRCTNRECQEGWLPGTLRDNECKCKKCGTDLTTQLRETLIRFEVALDRSQSAGWMHQYTMSEVLALDDKERNALKKLCYVGDGLLNFVPRTWAIQVPARDQLVLTVVGTIDRLVSGKHNIFLEDLQMQRVRAAIIKIRKSLELPFAKDYVESA